MEIGMYDDRIDIISFGGLEYGKSIEEIIKNPMSSRRNPLICDIFSRLDYMERRGSGIAKMLDAYNNDKKKPRLEVVGNAFIVTFYSRLYKKEKYILKLCESHPQIIRKSSENHPKSCILNYIKRHGKVAKRDIMENVNLTEGQIKYNLKVLKDSNQIQSIGKGKNTYYTIVKK